MFDKNSDLEIGRQDITAIVHIATLPGPSKKKKKVERPFKEKHSASSAGVFKEPVLRGVLKMRAGLLSEESEHWREGIRGERRGFGEGDLVSSRALDADSLAILFL